MHHFLYHQGKCCCLSAVCCFLWIWLMEAESPTLIYNATTEITLMIYLYNYNYVLPFYSFVRETYLLLAEWTCWLTALSLWARSYHHTFPVIKYNKALTRQPYSMMFKYLMFTWFTTLPLAHCGMSWQNYRPQIYMINKHGFCADYVSCNNVILKTIIHKLNIFWVVLFFWTIHFWSFPVYYAWLLF